MKAKELIDFLMRNPDKEVEIVCITQYRDGWELLEDKKIYHPNGVGELEDVMIIQAIKKEGMLQNDK